MLWGPSTHNPAQVLRKTLRKTSSTDWPISPICMWKLAESAPSGQMRYWRPNGHQFKKKVMPFGSPPQQGLKNCGLLQKKSLSTFFRAHWGDFCSFSAAGHILWLAYYLALLATPGTLNPAWVLRKPLILKWSVLWSRYGHIPGTGAMFSNAVQGVTRVICG